jgi:hypothetical protein
MDYQTFTRVGAAALLGGALLLAGACSGGGDTSSGGSTSGYGAGAPANVSSSGTPGVPPAAAGNQTGTSGGTGLQAATAAAFGTATTTSR